MTRIVYRYHVLNGVMIRQPFDLDAQPPESGIDWLHTEVWNEPPSRVVDEIAPRKLFEMRCCSCGHTGKSKGVCNCHKCGRGWMRRMW